MNSKTMAILVFLACLLAATEAFTPSAITTLPSKASSRCPKGFAGRFQTAPLGLRMAIVKRSPLEDEGQRGLEEEERRVGLWKNKFGLDSQHIEAIREEFESALQLEKGEYRQIPQQTLKKVLVSASAAVDTVDVSKSERPVISEDELNNYIKALQPLWEETCEQDAVEVANGECLVKLDTENFDLSEAVAIFGMCQKEHCGIGGVCFWDD